jgi:hypothetical protein
MDSTLPIQSTMQNSNTNINTGSVSNQVTLDQTTISQIVSGLQQASSSGITQLHSRDLPRNTESIVQDPQVQTNYIPPTNNNNNDFQKNRNYIDEEESLESMIHQYNKPSSRSDSLDDVYSELQGPLLLSVLYFLFQLPIFKKFLFQYFSVLFQKDGNYNINGYLFTSILFIHLYKTTSCFFSFSHFIPLALFFTTSACLLI